MKEMPPTSKCLSTTSFDLPRTRNIRPKQRAKPELTIGGRRAAEIAQPTKGLIVSVVTYKQE